MIAEPSPPKTAHIGGTDGNAGAATLRMNPSAHEIATPISPPTPDSSAASVVRDVERATGMWSPAYNQWFAGGASDPELSLIKIEVARVEFWDRKAGRMREL